MTKPKEDPKSATSELVSALAQAIELTRPLQKKTILNRKKGGPFATKDGTAKLKLRRTHYQHAIRMVEDTLSSDEIGLLNKIRPGSYCDGVVKVILRKDRGIDLDYPAKTASQRLRLVNQFGVVNLKALLERVVAEAAEPKKAEEIYQQD